ncbi:T7SS effector LXG polymorphic toxin [Listeria monocytogenes]|uniref:T7SS effector LXG polymorphic toxin n=1 Tax=Listeria monocytogenes TaxID=1639 RepID=UPI0002FC33A4|nr:T7SS effector LXG polymorphic toxin [Listeria monocytogenes]
MSRIDIGEIQAFLYQLRANEEGKLSNLCGRDKVCTGDNSLKGKAVDASKNYYQMTYFPLCDDKRSYGRKRRKIGAVHPRFSCLDADGLYELGKMIDRTESKKEALVQRINMEQNV